jgi:single-strand DNA-binding protein
MSVGETYLTVQGRVGGDVRFKEVSGKVALASFRIGTTPRQFDKTTGGWIDRPTAWFTVECWRTLAQNVHDSLQRGHPVVVTGRLKTTEWIEEGEKKSRTVIDAFSVGHDLARGTTSFKKNPPRPQAADGTSLDGEMRELSDDAEADDPGAEDSPFSAEEVAAVHDRESERQTPERQAA